MKPNLKKLQAAVQNFNNRVSVGDFVDYQEVKGHSAPFRTRTRSAAEILQGHTAVVWLEGKSGCVCIDHCTILDPQPASSDGKPATGD